MQGMLTIELLKRRKVKLNLIRLFSVLYILGRKTKYVRNRGHIRKVEKH